MLLPLLSLLLEWNKPCSRDGQLGNVSVLYEVVWGIGVLSHGRQDNVWLYRIQKQKGLMCDRCGHLAKGR